MESAQQNCEKAGELKLVQPRDNSSLLKRGAESRSKIQIRLNSGQCKEMDSKRKAKKVDRKKELCFEVAAVVRKVSSPSLLPRI